MPEELQGSQTDTTTQSTDFISTPSLIQTDKIVIVGRGQNQSMIEPTRGFTGRRNKRVVSIISSATPTINTDLTDCYSITALTTAITSFTTNLTGTPNDFDVLIIRIKDDGTARAITWGASFVQMGVSLPLTTVVSKVLTVGLQYDSVRKIWGCLFVASEL